MNEMTSKNIIIIVLLGIIVGLFAALYNVTKNSVPLGGTLSILEGATTTDTTLRDGEEIISTKPSRTETIIKQAETTPTGTSGTAGTMAIVTYTSSGFIPPVIEVRQGTRIIFINSSNKPMWVISKYNPTAKEQQYPDFDQGKSVAPGETFTFYFLKEGVWEYKNLNFDEHLGTVSVIPQ